MMTSAAAPIVVGGREFKMRKFNDKDIDELTLWLRRKVLKDAFAASEGLEDEEREMVISMATAQSREIHLQNPKGRAMLKNIDAMTRMVYQCLVGCTITYDAFHELVLQNVKDLELVTKQLNELNLGSGTSTEKNSEDGPNA